MPSGSACWPLLTHDSNGLADTVIGAVQIDIDLLRPIPDIEITDTATHERPGIDHDDIDPPGLGQLTKQATNGCRIGDVENRRTCHSTGILNQLNGFIE